MTVVKNGLSFSFSLIFKNQPIYNMDTSIRKAKSCISKGRTNSFLGILQNWKSEVRRQSGDVLVKTINDATGTRKHYCMTIFIIFQNGIINEDFYHCYFPIGQFLTRFSTSDWFLAMFKISTEHGSRAPVGSCFGNRKQHWTKSSGKLFLLFIVTYRPLPGLAWKSMKHNFWNSWKSVSLV